jgi:pimeloyl-ACP methyl ester carboxylesterase
MVDRFLLWLGAGVVTAGISAAMMTGAGSAAAETGSGTDSGGATSSESSKPAGDKADSDKNTDQSTTKPADSTSKTDSTGSATTGGSTGTGTSSDAGSGDSKADEEDVTADADGEKADQTKSSAESTTPATGTGDPAVEQPANNTTTAAANDHGTAAAATQQVSDQLNKTAAVATEPDVKKIADDPEPAVATAEPEATVPELALAVATAEPEATVPELALAVTDNTEPEIAPSARASAVAFSAPEISVAEISAAAVAPQPPALINVIGTLIFNLYSFATRLIGGPPVVPPGSTVTVRQSTLQIDCGDGYVVPADWYVPAGAEQSPPEHLIYLQHGFLASGPWYSYTAATLAEQTNSIVVAPSLTSNFFACDACWLGAAPMQRVVADLFRSDNTALAGSALAAGYTEALPERVVLVGHSLGGGLVAATAGYMVKNNTIGRLAGVVMLDGVGMNDAVPTGLANVPDELPIYQLAAPSYFWNQFGAANDALVQARPDRFVGVVLEGGSHVDAMQGGNPLIQFSQQLVAGFSRPQNVEAAKILMVGWINDMFAGTEDGIYGEPGEVIFIDTPAGQATAHALPSSLTTPSLWNLLQPFVSLGMGLFTFEPTCGPVEPTCVAASSMEPLAS